MVTSLLKVTEALQPNKPYQTTCGHGIDIWSVRTTWDAGQRWVPSVRRLFNVSVNETHASLCIISICNSHYSKPVTDGSHWGQPKRNHSLDCFGLTMQMELIEHRVRTQTQPFFVAFAWYSCPVHAVCDHKWCTVKLCHTECCDVARNT